MNYAISLGSWGAVFAVPKELVDNELRLCGAVPLKVILYILCHSGEEITDTLLSERLGYDQAVIREAIGYWLDRGLICDRDGLAVPTPAAEAPAAAAPEQKEEKKREKPVTAAKTKMRYSYGECVEMIGEDPSLAQMLTVLETILSKQLNHSEISAFITLVKWYGMPTECVAIIAEHCKSIGKPTAQYIESVTVNLIGQEINTIEAVSGYVERVQAGRRAWNKVRSMLEIPERKPTPKETEITSRWINEYCLADELIQYAYELTVNRKGKLAFPYMDGIIKQWRMKGITDVEGAKASEETVRSKKTEGSANRSDYDYKELEEMLYNDWMNDE